LLNYILTEQHEKRIAVILNEFGEGLCWFAYSLTSSLNLETRSFRVSFVNNGTSVSCFIVQYFVKCRPGLTVIHYGSVASVTIATAKVLYCLFCHSFLLYAVAETNISVSHWVFIQLWRYTDFKLSIYYIENELKCGTSH
jgi:hypothetical protein